MIRRGANIDSIDKNHQTPLFNSVMLGCDKIAEHLLKAGANVNAQEIKVECNTI